LLACDDIEHGDGAFTVALAPLLASAVLGQSAGVRQYVHIDLAEVRRLRSAPARLIHQRLCAWIDHGRSGKATGNTLAGYLWPTDPATGSALRMRRQVVRKALVEIQGLGWVVTEYEPEKFKIRRPALLRVKKEGQKVTWQCGRTLTLNRANADSQNA
jgi:hypothetical protein